MVTRKKVRRKIRRQIIKRIITCPRGHDLMNVSGGKDLRDKLIKLLFRKRSVLGKLIKARRIMTSSMPRGMRLMAVDNNKPKIGKVTLTFIKR